MSGRAHYSVALDAAREVANDQLTAIAHGYAAQLAAAEGMTTAALDHLTAAREHARSTPAIASWLATIEATIYADRGDHAAARDALDRAHTALGQLAGRSIPAWFHHYATAQLTAATGHIFLRSGDHSHASEVLTPMVGDSRLAERRLRVLILIDLATAELHSGNLAAACSHVTQAAALLRQAAYAVGTVRLRAFRTAAERPLSSAALRALDEHLIRIAA
jgi:ATP/maltotriose-dependent transcriptional regulator MalT